jgi:hypothetical protein
MGFKDRQSWLHSNHCLAWATSIAKTASRQGLMLPLAGRDTAYLHILIHLH